MSKQNIIQVLDRLARAKDSTQFKQILSGYSTQYQKDMEMLSKIYNIEEIWRLGRHRR